MEIVVRPIFGATVSRSTQIEIHLVRPVGWPLIELDATLRHAQAATTELP